MGLYASLPPLLLALMGAHLAAVSSVNIQLDQALCGFKFENYSIQWAFEPHSKNVVFVLKHKIDKNSFLTGIGFGDRKQDFVDFIGVFLKNGQIGIADTYINSVDGKMIPDASTNVQSIAFDYTSEVLTAKFARSLESPDNLRDHSLSGCQIFNFPVKGGSISRSGIVLDFDEMVEKRICHVDKNCVVDLKKNEPETVQNNSEIALEKEVKPEIAQSVDISGTGDPCSFTGVGYTVNWTYNPESEMVDFVMKHAVKQGKWWSALGIGDTMADMDIAIIFISSGRPKRIRDYFASSYGVPTEDKQNDWILSRQRTKSVDGMIELGFSRKLETGNNDDDRSLDGCVLFQFAANGGRYGAGYAVQKHDDWPDLYKACDLKAKCLSKESSKRQEPSVEESVDDSVEEASIDEEDEPAGNGKGNGKGKGKNRKHKGKNNKNKQDEVTEAPVETTPVVVVAAVVEPSSTVSPSLEMDEQLAASTTASVEGAIGVTTVAGLEVGGSEAPAPGAVSAVSEGGVSDSGFETTLSMSFSPLSMTGASENAVAADGSTLSGSTVDGATTMAGNGEVPTSETSITASVEGSAASEGTTTPLWTMDPNFTPMLNGEMNTSRNNLSADDLRTAAASGEGGTTSAGSEESGTTVAGDSTASPAPGGEGMPGNVAQDSLQNSHLLLAASPAPGAGVETTTASLSLSTILSGGDSTSVEGGVGETGGETPASVAGDVTAVPSLTTILSGGDSVEVGSLTTVLTGASGTLAPNAAPANEGVLFTFGALGQENSEATTPGAAGTGPTEAGIAPTTAAGEAATVDNGVSGATAAPGAVTGNGETQAPAEGTTAAGSVPAVVAGQEAPGTLESTTGSGLTPNGAEVTTAASGSLPIVGFGSTAADLATGMGSTAAPVGENAFGETTPTLGEMTSLVPVVVVGGEATTAGFGLPVVSGDTPPTTAAASVADSEGPTTGAIDSLVTVPGGLFGGLLGSATTAAPPEGSTGAASGAPESTPVSGATVAAESNLTTLAGAEAVSGAPADFTAIPADTTTVETATVPSGVVVGGISSEAPIRGEGVTANDTVDESTPSPVGGATFEPLTVSASTDAAVGASEVPESGETSAAPDSGSTEASNALDATSLSSSEVNGLSPQGIPVTTASSEASSGRTPVVANPFPGIVSEVTDASIESSSEVPVPNSETTPDASPGANAEVTGQSVEASSEAPVASSGVTGASVDSSSEAPVPPPSESPASAETTISAAVSSGATDASVGIDSSESPEIEGSGQESGLTEATSMSADARPQTTPVPGPFGSQNIVNELGHEAVGNPAEGCGTTHEDFSLCAGYFKDYMQKVQEWAQSNGEPMADQYGKACTLLKRVNNVPSLCCRVYYDTCKGHVQL